MELSVDQVYRNTIESYFKIRNIINRGYLDKSEGQIEVNSLNYCFLSKIIYSSNLTLFADNLWI